MSAKTKSKQGKATEKLPAPNQAIPRRFLRLVMQVEDTPNNRLITEAAVKAVKFTLRKPEGFGAILKYESIFMVSAEKPI